MPGTSSAKKRNRQNKRRNIRNRAVKSKIKSEVRMLRERLASGNSEEAAAKLREAIRIIDKAAGKGILHRNTARRKISRITKYFNKTAAAQKKSE